MTTHTTSLTYELHHQVKVAIRKIGASETPKILTWNGRNIVTTAIDGKRAAQLIEQSNCLGVYNSHSTEEEIESDLLVVMEQKDF